VLRGFAKLLELDDVQMLVEVISALDLIFEQDFQVVKEEETAQYQFEVFKGLDALDRLQKHPNKYVFGPVDDLIDKYFDAEKEDNT